MFKTIIGCILLLTYVQASRDCWEYYGPSRPNFPQLSNVVSSVTPVPGAAAFEFRLSGVPYMKNVIISISEEEVDPRQSVLKPASNRLSSGTTCHFDKYRVNCPEQGSIFEDSRYTYTMTESATKCTTMDIVFRVSISDADSAGAVQKLIKPDETHYTFTFFVGYFVQERFPDETGMVWGHAQQVPFIFKTAVRTLDSKSADASLLYMSYWYSADANTAQAHHIFTVSTNIRDAVTNLTIADSGYLKFYDKITTVDLGASQVISFSNRQLPTDLTPIFSTIDFKGLYCKGAVKLPGGSFSCQEQIEFHANDNHVWQISFDKNESSIQFDADFFHGDQQTKFDRSASGPVVIGATDMWVVWQSAVLSSSSFAIDSSDLQLYISDYGFKSEEIWLPNDLEVFTKDSELPADFDPSIRNGGKLFVAYKIRQTEHTKSIAADGHEALLRITVNVKAADALTTTTDVKQTTDGAVEKMWKNPVVTTSSNPKPYKPASVPYWTWILVAIGGSAFVVLAVAGIVLIVKRRKNQYTELA